MKKIVIASNNLGKLNEIGAILTPLDIEIVAQGTLGVSEAVVENEASRSLRAILTMMTDDTTTAIDTRRGRHVRQR